jgi:hypothetical protein
MNALAVVRRLPQMTGIPWPFRLGVSRLIVKYVPSASRLQPYKQLF